MPLSPTVLTRLIALLQNEYQANPNLSLAPDLHDGMHFLGELGYILNFFVNYNQLLTISSFLFVYSVKPDEFVKYMNAFDKNDDVY